jgi:hypothetical protein
MATVPASLVRLCESQGIDLYALPDSELLPAIVSAVAAEHRKTKLLLAKSALVIQQAYSYCPNDSLEREESVPVGASSPADPNSPLDNLFPF